MKTYSSLEEAHHWNIQAKFYSMKGPHIVICMYDDLYGVQGIEDEVLVCPFLSFYFFLFLFFPFFLFWWPQWLFLFNSHLSSLGSFDFVLFGIFSSLLGQYSIFYKNIGDLSHFTKVLTKRKCNYHDANLCLFQGSRICNDTSASCSND